MWSRICFATSFACIGKLCIRVFIIFSFPRKFVIETQGLMCHLNCISNSDLWPLHSKTACIKARNQSEMTSEAGHFLLNLRQLILSYTLNIFLSSCSPPVLEKGERGYFCPGKSSHLSSLSFCSLNP